MKNFITLHEDYNGTIIDVHVFTNHITHIEDLNNEGLLIHLADGNVVKPIEGILHVMKEIEENQRMR